MREFKVGQTVEHELGFFGEVTDMNSSAVVLRVTDPKGTEMRPGETYYASPECIDRILSESKPAEEITVKITLDGATDLMEQLTDVAEAFDEMTEAAAEASNIDLEILKETSVFEAEIGDGMKFKGTKSDFKAYIEGVERITKTSIGLTSLLEK